jgi:hypothetical protein
MTLAPRPKMPCGVSLVALMLYGTWTGEMGTRVRVPSTGGNFGSSAGGGLLHRFCMHWTVWKSVEGGTDAVWDG